MTEEIVKTISWLYLGTSSLLCKFDECIVIEINTKIAIWREMSFLGCEMQKRQRQ